MFQFVTRLTNFISDIFSSNRFTSTEHANNVNTTLDKIIEAFMAAWNFFDNNYMSFYKNVTRFVGGVPLGEELALFIPLLFVGAIIYFFVEVWYHYLHRDAWDAYWTREAEKLRHIKSLLETLQKTPNSEEKTARLNKIAFCIKAYEEDTKNCRADKNDLNGQAALAEVKRDIASLKEQLTTDYNIDWDAVQTIDDASQPISPKISPKESLINPSDSDQKGNEEKPFITPEPPAPKTLKDELLSFTNSSGFTTVFAFAWGYWFVYYFALWGVPAAVAFVAVPPLFALIGLVCPIAYLIYKEYKAYQAAVWVEETLTEQEKNQLNGMTLKAKRQILRNKTSDTRQFRYGWGFVALIAGLAIFMSLQPLIALPLAMLAGAGVVLGVGLLLKGITGFLDKRAEFRREEPLAIQSPPPGLRNSELLIGSDELNSLEEATISTAPLPENRTRKAWAMERKRQLKSAEQAAYQLMELAKLEASLVEFGVGKIDNPMLLDELDNNDENSEEIKVVPTSKQPIAEQIKSVVNNGSIDGEAEKKRTHQIRLAYAHMILGMILDFFTGYMLMCLLGFALGDFLSPISNLLGFAGSLLEQVFFNVTVGGLGLLCAGSKAYLTYQDQSKKIADLENALNQEAAYQTKQNEVLALIKLSNEKREALNAKLNHLIKAHSGHQANLEALQKLLIKPKKPHRFTLRKFVKGLRQVISALTSISSVILIARAIVTMGILGGAFTTLLLNGSLIVFGTVVMSSNPLGIAILSIAAALMVARLVRELYLQVKTERNLKKTEELDLKYERKIAEYERLEVAEKGINQLGEKLPDLEPTETSENFVDRFFWKQTDKIEVSKDFDDSEKIKGDYELIST